jgi:hypothetical protein
MNKDDERHGSSPASKVDAQGKTHGMASQSCPHTTTMASHWSASDQDSCLDQHRKTASVAPANWLCATSRLLFDTAASWQSKHGDLFSFLEFLCSCGICKYLLAPVLGVRESHGLRLQRFGPESSEQGCLVPSLRLTNSGSAGLRLAQKAQHGQLSEV